MSYAVFDTKADSIYNDAIEKRYHFPSRYLQIAQGAVGDWIIYREPRANGGRMAYFAAARLVSVETDPGLANHYYANVEDFTEFDHIVHWQTPEGIYREGWLRDIPQKEVGVQMRGKSVRALNSIDFMDIIRDGLGESLELFALSEADTEGPESRERAVKTVLSTRKVRERSFRRNVISAYANTCAFTGLSIVDHKGNPEVQAAHIRGVQHDGPDSTNNGLALSATTHWLFDRFLISLTDDFELLFNPDRLPISMVQLLEPQRSRIKLPKDKQLWPALRFVQYHRNQYDSLYNYE